MRLGPGPGALHLPLRLSEPLLHSERHDPLWEQLPTGSWWTSPLTGPSVHHQPSPDPRQPHSPLTPPLLSGGSPRQRGTAAPESPAHAGASETTADTTYDHHSWDAASVYDATTASSIEESAEQQRGDPGRLRLGFSAHLTRAVCVEK